MMERKKFRYEPYPNILLTNYHQERLENGLSFYYYQDTELPLNSAGIYLVVKVGSLYEDQNESGFSHFLEHLLVRAGIDQAQVNSFRNISGSHDEHETKFDHTFFGFLAQSQPEISDAIKLLGTMSTKVSLRKEHLDAERDIIILEDMGSLENSNKRNGLIVESQICNKDIKELCTAGHFQEMLLGSSISEDQINSFYKKWYHLSNMGLIVVGNCNLKDLMDSVTRWFREEKQEVPTFRQQQSLGPIVKSIEEKNWPDAVLAFKYPRVSRRSSEDFLDIWNREIIMESFIARMKLFDFTCSGFYRNMGILQACIGDSGKTATHVIRVPAIREVLKFGLLEEEVKVGAYEKINELKHQVSEFRRVESSRIAILKDDFVNHFLYNDVITDSFNVLTLTKKKPYMTELLVIECFTLKSLNFLNINANAYIITNGLKEQLSRNTIIEINELTNTLPLSPWVMTNGDKEFSSHNLSIRPLEEEVAIAVQRMKDVPNSSSSLASMLSFAYLSASYKGNIQDTFKDRQATQRRVANYKESWNCVISRLFPSEFTNNNVAFLLSRDPPIGGSSNGGSSSSGSGSECCHQ
ncbi:hypothetical protein OROHE_010397 [Orobanche hederae]